MEAMVFSQWQSARISESEITLKNLDSRFAIFGIEDLHDIHYTNGSGTTV